jgi:hypothetical protein
MILIITDRILQKWSKWYETFESKEEKFILKRVLYIEPQ